MFAFDDHGRLACGDSVVLVLRTHGPASRSRPGRLLLWSTIAVTTATLAIPFLGPLSSVSALQMGTVIAIVISYTAVTEVMKLWFYGR